MATDTSPILALDAVVGGYGKVTILNGTTFQIARGAITTVIGPNGAGKSTVFKAIFGLLTLRAGRITFDGQDVTGLAPASLLKLGISYVPQGRNIFPELSVLHNLELGGYAAPRGVKLRERIDTVLDRFPALRSRAKVQASTLSGGQQKLLEIARALLLEPKLLLIDEPSIGLSPLMVQETFDILADMRDRGVSVLMVEQNARSALQRSDYGLVLELGETRLHDRAATILADPRVGQLFLGAGMGNTAAGAPG
ncbi:ABC transporter ATP-binding protein [Caenimonas terrae]|uniref:ABC transporter ATP-binding protein n=1 Tax=Caenimonas terrae TaxID=696074 RepID=A0ABW0NKT8_9BURK